MKFEFRKREPEESKKAYKAAYNAARYAARKAEGKCACGKDVVSEVFCQDCLNKMNARYAARKAEGKCACGKDVVSEAYCQDCLDKKAARYDARKAEGKCECGKDVVSKVFCQDCLDKKAAYAAAHNAALNAKYKEKNSAYRHYKTASKGGYTQNMIFCPEWDTAKGTPQATSVFAKNAGAWMKENMPCPEGKWELHVTKNQEPYPRGYFGPGGFPKPWLVWLPALMDRHEKQILDTPAAVKEDIQ